MAESSFLPALAPSDVAQVAQLIQQVTTGRGAPEDQRRVSQELFEIQKRPEAYGLVLPFLEHTDVNVQFFGAHTIQVKIARDWESFPQDHALVLRSFLVDLTARTVAANRSKVVLRKLFVALCSLALKLVPGHPTRWPDWIMACVTTMSGHGAPTEHILDFLAIVAEELDTAELTGPSKAQVHQSLIDATAMVVQAITTTLANPASPRDLAAALRCLEAWTSQLPSSDITPLIPALIAFLNNDDQNETAFVSASNALQEIMTKSALSDGSGTKSLTEPLLLWVDTTGAREIVETTLSTGDVSVISHSMCQLLVALGDHSTQYLAAHIASSSNVSSTKGHLVQTFLKAMLSYTALPGYHGVDEDESELTLGFWYLFQEALWSTDYYIEEGEENAGPRAPLSEKEDAQWAVAKAVYSELVQVLRRKVMYPPGNPGWGKDQEDKFRVYRRDVGDTLINAYYVLRNDMLAYYVNAIVENLSTRQQNQGWEDVEATLHCIMSIQESIPLEYNPHLGRVFSPEVLNRLPSSGAGQIRLRRTALSLIGTYATWFTTNTTTTTNDAPPLLMTSITYVVAALSEPALSFQAANALRDLCDANRSALAPHIGAFAALHAGLTGVAETEKSKILQSIASVIQALPPYEEIPPVEAIVNPVVENLTEALRSSSHLPDEARALAIIQLETLTGVAKGLTSASEPFTDSDSPSVEETNMTLARNDPRMMALQAQMLGVIHSVVDVWASDAGVANSLSDLFKAITSLPADATLISLPPGPVLELVCIAARRSLTAVWLSLAGILVVQLRPPLSLVHSGKPRNNVEVEVGAEAIAATVLPILLDASLQVLSRPNAMEDNPDIVQNFFGCLTSWTRHFVGTFYGLPEGALDTLMQCAILALGLQERYSFVAACGFLATLINETFLKPSLVSFQTALITTHGKTIVRSIIVGVAGATPRSAIANLVELLATLLTRFPAECRVWVPEIVFGGDLDSLRCKATEEDKRKFVKGLESRTTRRIRDATQNFALVARGLQGSSFGQTTMALG